MKPLVENVISRDFAMEISPKYVDFIEKPTTLKQSLGAHWILDQFYQQSTLKLGRKVLTYHRKTKQFVLARIALIDWLCPPMVRVGNGERTWRVDNDVYAVPVSDDLEARECFYQDVNMTFDLKTNRTFVFSDGIYTVEMADLQLTKVPAIFRLKNCPVEGESRSFEYYRTDSSGGDAAGWWFREVGNTSKEALKVLIIND